MITIVQSEENIFGGFTEESWSSKYSSIVRFVEQIKETDATRLMIYVIKM